MENTTWVHNLDPFLVEPFDVFGLFTFPGVRYYGLAYFTGFVCGYFIISWMAKRKLTPMKVIEVADFITYIILGVMLGGRLGYVFFYSPDLLFKVSDSFPFWGALEVHKGGMASHGGMIGVVVACILFGRRYKMSPLHVGDLSILGASIGIFLGRVANFINGELMGRVAESPISWAVKFPQDMYRWIDFGNPQWKELYAAKLEGLKSAVPLIKDDQINISSQVWAGYINDIVTYKDTSREFLTDALKQAYINAKYEVSNIVNYLVDAPSKGYTEIATQLGKVLDPRHPSQLYAAVSEGLIPFLFIVILWRKPQKPGVIGAAFLTLYPISRIINEQFRLPDAHLGYQLFDLTRGQWLSIAMFFMAGSYLIWCLKRESDPIGGWSKLTSASLNQSVEEDEDESEASSEVKPEKKNSNHSSSSNAKKDGKSKKRRKNKKRKK